MRHYARLARRNAGTMPVFLETSLHPHGRPRIARWHLFERFGRTGKGPDCEKTAVMLIMVRRAVPGFPLAVRVRSDPNSPHLLSKE